MVTLRTLTFVCLVAVISIRNVAGKCQFSHGNYKLEWAVDKKNVVHFLLTYRNYPTGANSWTGVAFGEGMMYGLDAIVVRNMNDQISVSDEFVQGYGPSSTDGTQDVKTKSAKLDGGVLKVQFSRPADTPDRQFDLPLSGCKTWQISWHQVSQQKVQTIVDTFVTSVNHMFGSHTGKHSETPVSKRVCLNQCSLR